MGPIVIPFSVPANVIFSEIVFAFVLTILLVPSEGPPNDTAESIFAAVTAPSTI